MRAIHEFLPWDAVEYESWCERHARAAVAVRAAVPSVAEQVAKELVRQDHDYPAGPGSVEEVNLVIGQYVRLIHDPAAPMAETVEYFRQTGHHAAASGQSLHSLHKTLLLATRMAVHHLTQVADQADPALPAAVYGGITAGIFPYLDVLLRSASRGHAQVETVSFADDRSRLASLLTSGVPTDSLVLRRLAERARWPLPRTVAAVALDTDTPGGLPADVLTVGHAQPPFLIVPDPEGPGRRRALSELLGIRRAAIGPTVHLSEVGESLRWARQTLDLMGRGIIPANTLTTATDHMPLLVIMHEPELIHLTADGMLRPLRRIRGPHRQALARTLLSLLQCGFNATLTADRMRLHPQTVRYRLRQLDDLFGDTIHNPEHHMELQMMLHAWLAAN